MKSRRTAACVLVALVCSTVLISSIGFAQSAAQSPEFLASLTRVQQAERSGNDRQPPEKVMDAIGLKAGMVVGEVGAGRGRYTKQLARRVGPAGKVYANDIASDAGEHRA
jgi:predicted methyltransferase